MKAISLKQPWAWLISECIKTIETRTWKTEYRGDLLIVSSKKPDVDSLHWFKTKYKVLNREGAILYGQALAIVTLVDCRPMNKEDETRACCDLYEGAYSWVMRNIRKIDPFPVKGQLSIYDVEISPKGSKILTMSKKGGAE